MTSLKIIETKKGKRIKHRKGKIILEKNKKQIKTRRSKSHRLEEALKEEKAKSKEYLNRLMYLQADFENYRKRVEKELRETILFAKENLILDLLSVVDELELALQSGRNLKNNQTLLEGVEMTLKKMYITLEHEGLARIEAVGEHFDPKKHEAVSKVPTNDHVEGTVVEEIRKGFILREKVIRPSVVKIAAKEGIVS